MNRPSPYPRPAVATAAFSCLLLCVAAPAQGPRGEDESYPLHADSQRKEGVPEGRVLAGTFAESAIYPGTVRDYWVYVPAGHDGREPACLMVFQDGAAYVDRERNARVPTVFDNLIHQGEMPATIGLFVNPGVVPAPDENAEARYNRSFEYDGMGDRYARFLIEEMIPHAAREHGLAISADPDDRALCGASSGGICAFTAAWERPDAFRRVYSMIGTFVGLRGGNEYPALIRKTEPKPLRIYLQDGANDLDIYGGDWWMANQTMLRALEFAGYEVGHTWGEGFHNHKHGAAIFPDVMRWLWKDHGTVRVATHPDRSRSRAPEFLVEDADWEIVSTGHGWAEGLAVGADGTLFLTDVPEAKLYRIPPDGERSLVASETGNANGIALGPDGNTLYTASSGTREIRAYDTTTGEHRVVASGTTSNDVVVSHSGHLFYTDPGAGAVWHVDLATGTRSPADPDFPGCNGIGMSADQTLLFVADFAGRFIVSYRIQPDGTLAHKQPFFFAAVPPNDPRGLLDGMTSTTSGHLVAATAAGIQIFDQPGRVQLVLPRPAGATDRTNYVVFGGPDGRTLYAATRETVYRRRLQLEGAHPWKPPVKPPRPKL